MTDEDVIAMYEMEVLADHIRDAITLVIIVDDDRTVLLLHRR